MNNYFENLPFKIQQYFKILSPEFPEFLNSYIYTPEMQKQSGISVTCGTIYSKMFDQMWFSSLDHSVAVALIIWNFTKDKKQTLSGLFHDIATPVFKHSIDFMNKDYEKQESTEELTFKIISESKEIMDLLNKDKINVAEISDYHIYPIADNDTPKLSSDRLEYTLSNALGSTEKLWDLSDIEEIYNDIIIVKNEENIDELAFQHLSIAEKFVHTMSQLSRMYRREKTMFSMQFLADILQKMYSRNLITLDDLYKYSEKDIIEKIKSSNTDNISTCFKIWENATKINTTDIKPQNKYFVSIEKIKIRFINPLVQNESSCLRIYDISKNARLDIEETLNYKPSKYTYLDFNF